MNALRCTCGHGGRVSRRWVYLQVMVSFALLILGLLYDLQNLRFWMQYCTFTGQRDADKHLRCLLPRMDFGRNYHNATLYEDGEHSRAQTPRENSRTVDIFDDTPQTETCEQGLHYLMSWQLGSGQSHAPQPKATNEEVRADVVLAVSKPRCLRHKP